MPDCFKIAKPQNPSRWTEIQAPGGLNEGGGRTRADGHCRIKIGFVLVGIGQ